MESIIGDLEANIVKVEKLLEDSLSKQAADFVFLPEVWTVGWDCKSFPICSEDFSNSKAIRMLKHIAVKYSTNVIGGSLIEKTSDDKLKNVCPIIDRKGNLVCTYEKNHLYSYYGCNEGDYVTAGQTPVMVVLDGIKLGLSICYDIRFPEIYREYRKAGADILVNMAAWGSEKKLAWDTMTTSRAIENQSYFVALTQTGKLRNGYNLGHSMFIDYNGNILSEINISEGSFYTTIDLNLMYDFREKCKILNDIKSSYEVMVK